MADNSFRSNRSRDPGAPAAPSRRVPADDPLADLARLIGQGDAADDYGQSYDDAAPGGMDWAPDDGYADRAPAQPRFEVPRLPEPALPRVSAPPPRNDYEQPSPRRAAPPRFNGGDDPHDYTPVDQPRYGDAQESPVARGHQLPAMPTRAQDARYEHEDAHPDNADEQDYALEDYEEEAPRRRGFVLVAAVLGLAVLGTAAAFGYRAMFGGSMLPSLPPIIKAEDGPNKIVPNAGESHGAPTKQAAAGSGEKLVPREEKPVDVPAPVTTSPRVVSTIPVFPSPSPGAPGAPPIGIESPNMLTPAAPAPMPPGPIVQAPAIAVAPAVAAPAMPSPAASDELAAPAPLPPASATKKIHTVTIRSDQQGSAEPAAPSPPQAIAPSPVARAAAPAPRPAVQPPRQPSGANAPLAIVPPQGDAQSQPAPRSRTAAAPASRPTSLAAAAPATPAEPAASTGGGYAVQVTSQRSEAEAQSAYRALAAKYPSQLGGHAPIVRRADLGSKGVYYRALVGPFASMEQAASMCSSLKAAGATCLVQKN